ncbi:hypothetical protein MUO66_08055 [Candidatus Bathyarchaeota archaeon]|nr:hypothetical protein [Candidatus Bathyarchaeota archaeon]
MKLRLISWMRTPTGTIWLVSLAVGKSRRQINDWMNKRTKTKRVQKMSSVLANKLHISLSIRALNQVYRWCDALIPGDMIVLHCESAEPYRQFKAWGKWFKRKEQQYPWVSNPEFLSFYFYKHVNLE